LRWRYILNTVGVLTLFFGGTMVVPLAFDLFARDRSLLPLVKAMGITLVCRCRPGGLVQARKDGNHQPARRHGHRLCWDGQPSAVRGAAILFFRCVLFFVDAFFESVSGFTTTGSSILTDIEG
jgi:trk system potassium uptake protein TrkH